MRLSLTIAILLSVCHWVSCTGGQPMRRRDWEKIHGKSEDTRRLEASGPLTACRFVPVIGRCPVSALAQQEDKYYWAPEQSRCVRFERGFCDTSGKNQFMSWQDCRRACDPNNNPAFNERRYPAGSQWQPVTPVVNRILPFYPTRRYGTFFGGNRNDWWNSSPYGQNRNQQPYYNNNRNVRYEPTGYISSGSRFNFRCRLPDFVSNCAEEKLRYFFDPSTGTCKEYTPGYCDRRRENEFDYLQQCQSACH